MGLGTHILCFGMVATVVAFQLNIIEVIIGNNRMFGYRAIAPVYDVTFEALESQYPQLMTNYTRKRIYKPGIFSCPDSAAVMISSVVAEVMDYLNKLSGFNVLISPDCGMDVLFLGDFARELDIPLFSGASDPSLANKIRLPTTMTYGTLDYENMVLSVKTFIDRFCWKNIMLLCDSLSNLPGTNAYYALHCTNTKRILPVSGGQYQVKSIQFDSANMSSFDSILDKVKKQSRGKVFPQSYYSTGLVVMMFTSVVMVFTHPSVLRRMLIGAARNNMTNGEYVYLAPVATLLPTFGNLSWQSGDADDQTALEAFKSLISYTVPNPKYEAITTLSEARRQKSIYAYNLTFPDEDLICNKSICVLVTVPYSSKASVMFEFKMQHNDLAVSAYEMVTTIIQVLNETYLRENVTTMNFCRRFMNRTFVLPSRTTYLNSFGMRVMDVEYYQLDETSGKMKEVWHYYSREKKLGQVSANIKWQGGQPPSDIPVCGFQNDRCLTSKFGTILEATLACTVGFLVICLMIIRRKLILHQIGMTWWYLEADGMNVTKERVYKGHPVWVESVTCDSTKEQLMSSKQASNLFRTIKQIHHLNLSIFYGVCFLNSSVQLVYESAERGTLHNFLEKDNYFANSLQRSIIWEILDGMNYIQLTNLGFHGNLSPFVIFLDKRFTVKISGYATQILRFILTGSHAIQIQESKIAYIAPEYFAYGFSAPTKAADVYSISVVLMETIEKMSESGQLQPPWTELYDIFKSGKAVIPSERPSVKYLIKVMNSLLPREDILESIMQTLEQHAENLENLIAERTIALLAEKNKSDILLTAMIPAKFVNALRNKQLIPAEHFDCVSVMFSDLPEFITFCTHSTPMKVTALLNTIYVTLDTLIVSFDVYKVETINDSYMVASGLPERNGDQHVGQIALLALKFIQAFSGSHSDYTAMELRIGFHSGPCAAGIVGLRTPRYCLFGDTINTASRMESHSEASRIHLSNESKILLDKLGGFLVECRGEISIKGKGTSTTFWLIESK